MQRKSFIKLLLSGLLYMLLGNIMCAVMTVSLAPFITHEFIKIMSFLFSIFIFYALVFTVAFKDGQREQSMVRLRKVEEPNKNKWITIGFLMMGIMFLPSMVLLIIKISGAWFDPMIVFRFVCGMVYPLSILISPGGIDSMAVFTPVIYMLCYAAIPVATHIGFYLGYTDKLNKDKIMYK